MILVSSFFALIVGAALGVLGGGGSILMLPVLVYVLGLEQKSAISLSLLVVGATSAVALVSHARAGNVDFRRGALFGTSGMCGAYLGGRLSPLIPDWLLLTGFALLMLSTAASMLRREAERTTEPAPRLLRALAQGALVGVVSGLLGAGGGFLVVPTLVVLGGLTMRRAVGTSLLVIALQALAGFIATLPHAHLDWALAAWTSGAAILGSWAGAHWSFRLPQPKLRRWFAWLVLALGGLVLLEQVPRLTSLGFTGASFLPLAGGALIGLAAAFLWLLQGRVAGISGIVRGLFAWQNEDRAWRVVFVLGLFVGGLVMLRLMPSAFGPTSAPLAVVLAAGVLVGIGTTLANGCTSGHGVCGVSRLAPRSLVATLSFMLAGTLAVYVGRHLLGVPG